jgi:6,7-dimethyl-8-ribityllumazine synthase
MANLIQPAPEIDAGARFAIVVSRFNESMTADLLAGALAAFADAGLAEDRIDVVWVPGAWEIPLALQRLAAGKKYAALVALGVVIRGQTTHDRQINRFVSLSIGELSLKYDVPIALGVLTCKTAKQALRRCDPRDRNKGGEAARAALEMARLLNSLPN